MASQVAGIAKGAALGVFSGYALYFGLNLHMWNTVNDTLAALRSAEARLTGTDKISANVPNPFTEPAVDYADYELSRLAALRTRAEDWWNSTLHAVPGAVTTFHFPKFKLPDLKSHDGEAGTAPVQSGGAVVVETGGTDTSNVSTEK